MFHSIVWRTAILLSVVCVEGIGAQTRFEWPSKQADVGRYTRWEDCIGMARRVKDSVNGAGVLRDTLSPQQKNQFEVEADVLVAAAKRCTASIPLSSIAPDYATLLAQEVLLIAGRDADVIQSYRTRLAETLTDTGKIRVITSTVAVLIEAQPARLLLADSVLNDIHLYDRQWNIREKLTLLGRLCRLSDAAHNRMFVEKFCGGYLQTIDGMTEVERGGISPFLSMGYVSTLRIIKRVELADSLTKSVEAYVSLIREFCRVARWEGRWLVPVGEKAERLVGDFWFPANAKNNHYPLPGKITFITSVPMSRGTAGDVFGGAYKLKRITSRFPDLEIVALSGTTGHFGPVAPPPPAVEGELNYRRMVEFYGVPLVMAVTRSPTWRLAEPDRRRLFDPYAHSDVYVGQYKKLISAEWNRAFGWANGSGTGSLDGLLVDDKGIIVDYVSDEGELVSYIDILMKRMKH